MYIQTVPCGSIFDARAAPPTYVNTRPGRDRNESPRKANPKKALVNPVKQRSNKFVWTVKENWHKMDTINQ